MNPLRPFFEPESVVVIGASRNPDKLGYGVARNMIGSGFRGDIYLVNPGGGILFDRPLLKSIEELPGDVDLGLIVVPPKLVPETLIACGDKGIRHVIILTGGFRESGKEGAEIEAACQRIAREQGIRVIGPNCIGVLDTHTPLDTTFIQPPMPQAGEIAFITHSGALGAAMIDWVKGQGFGFSRVISLGNQMDVTESDVLLPTAQSPHTKVLTLYLESIQDGRKFIQKASQASKNKPVLALKVGRSAIGKKAAASHTGALAGSDTAYAAAFRRAGVQRVETIEDLFMKAKALAWCQPPKNNRVAILTNAGGPGVTAADALEQNVLQAAVFSEETIKRLAEILPDAASLQNPVDMLASASPQIYGACLELLAEDPGVDMVLVIAPPPPMFAAEDISDQLIAVAKKTSKPVVASFMGSRLVEEGIKRLRDAHIAEYAFPEDAVSALSALWQASKNAGINAQELVHQPSPGAKSAISALIKAQTLDGSFIPADVTSNILELSGLSVLGLRFADSPEGAVAHAIGLGYPVVMKVGVEGISHKSDVGGIILNLDSDEAVRESYLALQKKITPQLQTGERFGVHIQKMAGKGQEVIIGAIRDPVFGPMIMFGSGGVEVEGLKDIQFSIAPPTAHDLDYLLENTWAGKKLGGFRSFAKADAGAVRDALVKLGSLMADFPEIQEIEINPLVVMEDGQGAFAVDARMTGREA